MKKVLMLLVGFVAMLLVVNANALQLTDDLKLDGYVEYLHLIKDADARKSDPDTLHAYIDIQTNYTMTSELGLTYQDLVRVSGQFETIEYFQDTYGGKVEFYINPLFDVKLPVNLGLEVKYSEVKDRTSNETNQFVMAGAVARLP